MSEIVAHPADRWVVAAIWMFFVPGGAAAGVIVDWRFRSKGL